MIATNANLLRTLHDEIERTWLHRNEGPKQRQEWSEACDRFRYEYDQAAFPGGLEAGLAQLSQGDSEALEIAVQFLEEDPWFFRSGYIKQFLIQKLKQAALPADQSARLRNVVLHVVDLGDRREFRKYCGLAVKVNAPDLSQALADRATWGDAGVKRRAQWILNALSKERIKPG